MKPSILWTVLATSFLLIGCTSDLDYCLSGRVAVKKITACTRVIESGNLSSEDLAIAHYRRGESYAADDDYEMAIADYTKAIESGDLSGEKLRDAYYGRGRVYGRKVIRLTFRDPGNAQELENQLDLAIADYTKVIELDPAAYLVEHIYIDRGKFYEKKGNLDLAFADYTKAIEVDPDEYTYLRRGNAYADQGKHDLAIADYTKAIEIDSDYDSRSRWLRDNRTAQGWRSGCK